MNNLLAPFSLRFTTGVLCGETAERYPVYMPFDDVDVRVNLGDALLWASRSVGTA